MLLFGQKYTVSKLQCANKTFFIVTEGSWNYDWDLKLIIRRHNKNVKLGDPVFQCNKLNKRDLCHAQNIIKEKKEVHGVLEHQPTTVAKEGKKRRDMLSCTLNLTIWIGEKFSFQCQKTSIKATFTPTSLALEN